MFGEVEREIEELRGKMRQLSKTSELAVEVQKTCVKWGDREVHGVRSSDREDKGLDQDEPRTGSRLRKVRGLTGEHLISEDQGEARGL